MHFFSYQLKKSESQHFRKNDILTEPKHMMWVLEGAVAVKAFI